nr:uncharacterized protein CI109_003068 [Kwoniella shandongensis]KAA5528536.1 hypothetical protein CI109_003068 [Kwoniella shandongensis]
MTNDDRSSPAIGIWTNHLITSHIVRFLQAKDVASFIRVSRLHFEAGVGTLYRTFPYRHWQKVMKWCRDPSRLEAYANAVRVVDLNASSRTIQPIYWPEILSHFPNATQIERYTDTLTRHYPSVGEVVYTFSYIYPVTLDPLNVHEKPVRPTGIPEKWKLKRPLYVKALGKDFPQSPGEQRDVAFQDTLLERVKFLQAEVEELSVTFPVANRVLADIMKRLREQGTGLTKSIAIVSVDRDFFELVNALPSTTESIAALPQEYEDAELEADEYSVDDPYPVRCLTVLPPRSTLLNGELGQTPSTTLYAQLRHPTALTNSSSKSYTLIPMLDPVDTHI